MPLYTVSVSELLHYYSKEIQADTKEEAIEKYFEQIDLGGVEVASSEFDDALVNEH